MLRGVTRFLRFEVKDVREKILLERARRQRVKKGADGTEVDDDVLAEEAGLIPPRAVDVSKLEEEKQRMMEALEGQRLKRIARRAAFLEWQAGQREKGAAQRLVRQAETAEKYKRHHYNSRRGRILSLEYLPPAHGADVGDSRFISVQATGDCTPYTDWFGSRSEKDPDSISLSLRRKP